MKIKHITIYFTLIIFALFTVGCSKSIIEKDKNIFNLFMDAYCGRELVEAYSFISENYAVDNGRLVTTKNENALTLAEFENKIRSVDELLGVEKITYNLIDETSDGSGKTYRFEMTYETSNVGRIESDEYLLSAVLEDGTWKVNWSPSLIFPEMDWEDKLTKTVNKARRGDILANGKAIAITADLTTVYVNLTEAIGKETIIERIIENEQLEKYVLNQYSVYEDWNELDQADKDMLVEKRVLKLAESKFTEYFRDYEGKLKKIISEELDALAEKIIAVSELDREELDSIFSKAYGDEAIAIIKQYYPDELSDEQWDAFETIEGVHVATSGFGTGRLYPYGELLAHTLGYTAPIYAEEIVKYNENRTEADGLYDSSSYVGRNGIEKQYETELRGKDGYVYAIRNVDGKKKRVFLEKEKQDGLDINLTIDLELQQRTEELLELVLYGEDTAGAVIVINPKTGALNAVASYPTYDLNSLARAVSGYYDYLTSVTNVPLRNRATDGAYPPGSIFKAFTAAAALDEGVVTEGYIFTGNIVNDYWTPTGYGRWPWPAIKRTRVTNRTEPTNMANAMLHSDNIYFADLALKLGEEKFCEYMRKLGIDQKVPFELGGARSQIVSKNTKMNYKMLADSGYGQAQVLTTPLQLATMFSAFRNNGSLPVPYITDSFYRYEPDGVTYSCIEKREPQTWISNAISASAVEKISPMLQGVMDPEKNGTGRSLRVPDCVVAGKTGTAELDNEKSRIISWIAAYRINVSEEDERLVLVMLEVPNTGGYSSLKFQIARELLKLGIDASDPNAAPEE